MAHILALVMLLLVSAPVWIVYLADLLDGRRALQNDIHSFEAVVVCTAVIAWLLMALQGSMSFAFERDRSTLDALLTTPLSGRQIVLGKLAGIFRSSAFALLCPLLFIALALAHGVMSLRAGILGAVIVLVGAFLAAAWGLWCSISMATTVKAASYAFLAALVLLIGLPILNAAVLNRELQYNLLPMTFISPSVNLDYAVFERADHTSPYQGRFWGDNAIPSALGRTGKDGWRTRGVCRRGGRGLCGVRHAADRAPPSRRPVARRLEASLHGQKRGRVRGFPGSDAGPSPPSPCPLPGRERGLPRAPTTRGPVRLTADSTSSSTRCATSTPVAPASAFQPGTALTSIRYSAPSRPGKISTPASGASHCRRPPDVPNRSNPHQARTALRWHRG